MRYVLILLAVYGVWADSLSNEIDSEEPCEERPKCQQKDYRSYVRCIKNRVKRQVCPFAQQTAQNLQPQPQIASQVVPQFAMGQPYILPQNPTQCQIQYSNCLNTCPTPTCQAQCPYTCGNSIGPSYVYVQHPGNTKVDEKTGSLDHVHKVTGHNITTVIKLTNLVNNTNIVNVPTSINSTNINNINLNGTYGRGEWGLGANKHGSCCIAVHPRSCGGTSCRHARHRLCGPQCTSKVIHVNQRCRGGNCNGNLVYVPQPRPSCSYSHTWPYVNCGGRRERSCSGCYDHYGHGYYSYYSGRSTPDCEGCYDDGYDQGPLYRHGPYYQPGFYHQPPMFPYSCGPFGCFGNQFINPFAYPPPNYGYNRDFDYNYDGQFKDDESVQYIDEEEFYESLNKTYGGSNCTIRNESTGESIPCGSVQSQNPYMKNKLNLPIIQVRCKF